MAKLLKLRRGSTSQHSSFTGAEGEVTIDTTKDTAVVHDGAQAGGRPLAREDMSNVSSASIAGQLGTDSISVDKIAAGTLPSDVKVDTDNIITGAVTTGKIATGTIINGDISSSAAIAGTKINPNFGSQNISTTGNASISGTNLNMSTAYIDFSGSLGSAPTTAAAIYRPADNSLAISTGNSQRLLVNNAGASVTGNLDVSNGVDVTGNVACDGIRMGDGDEIRLGSSDDLKIFHDGNNSVIRDNGAGDLYLQVGTSNILRLQSSGVDVTGNITVTGTVDGRDVAADGSKLDNYQPNGSSYLRSDANDTATGDLVLNGQVEFKNTGSNPVVIGNTTGDNPQKLLIRGADSPFIQFRENNTDKAYLQWHSDGFFRIGNSEDSSQLRIKDDITFSLDGSTHYKVWHAGNDGSGSGLDADLLDGVSGGSYLRSDADDTATRRIVFSNNATDNEDTMATGTGNLGGIEITNSGSGNDAFMAFHAGGDFAFYLGIDADINDLAVGGWSMGAAKYRVWHQNNDGSGSGLDADLLDGVHGSSFLRSDAADSFNGTITMGTQHALVANNYGRGVYGLYDSTKYQHVWSMGTAYNISDDGTGYGNMYGLSYTHTNVGTGTNQSISGLSHQLQHRTNGTLTAAIGTGIWTSGNVTAYSDIAVKRNLVKIPNALEKVSLINGYTYERTDHVQDPEDPESPEILRQAGVVAQEVEKVLPEVVSGQEGNKAVAYGNMVALLIEAVKELKAEVEELKGGK